MTRFRLVKHPGDYVVPDSVTEHHTSRRDTDGIERLRRQLADDAGLPLDQARIQHRDPTDGSWNDAEPPEGDT